MSVVSIIPARGGSKGIPGKNIKSLAGKPLIAYTIEQSVESELIDLTVVSTDNDKIEEIALELGAFVIRRPPEISGDDATSESALTHALKELERRRVDDIDLVVFLQCTSPCRKKDDIDSAIKAFHDSCCDSLLSVVKDHRFIWSTCDGVPISLNYNYEQRQRRQDFEEQYTENGSIYIFTPEGLFKHNNRLHGKISMFEMSKDSIYEIDDGVDWCVVESLMSELI